MSSHKNMERTGGLYTNSGEYFEKDGDPGQLTKGYSRVAHQDEPNAVAYTQSRTARKGGGFDLGEKQYIYKKVKEKKAPAPKPEAAAPKAPEPEKDKGPVELSPEITEAKERVNNWKGSIDGTAGSLFSTSEPAKTPEPDAMPNSVSFTPAEIDTPTYNPNAGNAEQAQGFADKYKLNLLNKGAGQSDFSGV